MSLLVPNVKPVSHSSSPTVRGLTGLALVTLASTTGCEPSTVPVTGTLPGTVPAPATTRAPAATTPSPPPDAVAAARAYIDAYNIAAQTADTGAYDRVVAAGCPCREPFLTSFVGALCAHHWHTDARRVVTAATAVRQEGIGAIVDVRFHLGPYRVLDAVNRTVRPGRPDTAVLRISLVRSEGRWLVADVERR